MSIRGIKISATFEPPMPFTDEWLEAVYTSIENNMAIVSIDMFADEEKSTIRFHFGIDSFLDSESFVEDVAREALDKAFADANGEGPTSESPVVVSGAIEQFA